MRKKICITLPKIHQLKETYIYISHSLPKTQQTAEKGRRKNAKEYMHHTAKSTPNYSQRRDRRRENAKKDIYHTAKNTPD